MRDALKLIQSALADTSFLDATPLTESNREYINAFEVNIPEKKFRGIQENWIFAVINNLSIPKENKSEFLGSIETEIHDFIDDLPDQKPLVLLTDNKELHLSDTFGFGRKLVFSIDALELPGASNLPRSTSLSPFVRALKKGISKEDYLCSFFNPYQKDRPVSGRKFFGRKNKLNELISSDQNFIVVGARRIGKTSFLQEASRLLRKNGEVTHYVDVQNCNSPSDVLVKIAHALSIKDLSDITRRGLYLGEDKLTSILKQTIQKKKRTTLFLDELGNVISNLSTEDWKFMGTLRQFSQTIPNFRIIFSCFQEAFIKQQIEHGGPFVNFGSTMRLLPFSRSEVEEFVLAPIEVWNKISNKKAISSLVYNNVGGHPHLLQYFCWSFYNKIVSQAKVEFLSVAQDLFDEKIVECFAEPINEIFFNVNSSVLQYLYLKLCLEAKENETSLSNALFNNIWIKKSLKGIGFNSTHNSRRNILDALEIYGLTKSINLDLKVQQLSSPIISKYIELTDDIKEVSDDYAEDIEHEKERWGLTSIK